MNWCYRLVVLKPESGIAIHKSRASDQFTPTLDYLPGSTVRGAYAQMFINKRGVGDRAFRRIFVDEKVRFSDFLPSNTADLNQYPVLLPASAAACKRHKFDHRESLHDQLISQYGNSAREGRGQEGCPVCGEPLGRIEDKYIDDVQACNEIEFATQLRMHVGISRATGSTIHGMLFSHQLMVPKFEWKQDNLQRYLDKKDLYFIGTFAAPDDEADDLFREIDQVLPAREHLSIGASRTRGQGECVIQSSENDLLQSDFCDRWDKFNEKFTGKLNTEDKCFFSITLLSHLALRDKIGKPVLDEIEAKHLQLPETCTREVAFLNRAVVSGWNAAAGIPKPDTVALARGSVLLFSVPKDLANDLKKKLFELENEGIGERRAEGFGALAVCHSFHTEFAKE